MRSPNSLRILNLMSLHHFDAPMAHPVLVLLSQKTDGRGDSRMAETC